MNLRPPRWRAIHGSPGWKQRIRSKLPPVVLRALARIDRGLIAVTALPANRKVTLAVVGSLLVHGIGIAAVVTLNAFWPASPLEARSLQPIRLTIERSDAAEEQSATKSSYIRTPDDLKSDRPPERPTFESDKDTLAASERPPADPAAAALPSQEGREVPVFEFDTQPYRPGEKAADAATAAAAPAATPAKAMPSEKSVAKQRSKPSSKPQDTPSPQEFALLQPAPNPTQQPPEPNPGTTDPEPTATPRVQRPPPPSPRAAPPSVASVGPRVTPGYQQQTERVKIVGGIDNRGRSSVAALGTPLGRYEKAMQDAVGMRWYYGVRQRIDLINSGVVKIRFYITPQGRVQNPQILSGNDTGVLADVSLQAVLEARLPPMPPDVANFLSSGRLEVTYRFEQY